MSVIRFWIEQALEANRLAHTRDSAGQFGLQRGPFLSARALGMVLLAMHEAYAQASGKAPFPVAIPSGSPVELVVPPAPAGVKEDAVSAVAAFVTLMDLYDSQASGTRSLRPELMAAWAQSIALAPVSKAEVAYGTAVAKAVLAWRAGDRKFRDKDDGGIGEYVPSGSPYDHAAPPLDADQKFRGAAWGHAYPFLSDLMPLTPPTGSAAGGAFAADPYYKAEYDEVYAEGRDKPTSPADEKTFIGVYWGYDGSPKLGTPPRLYMQVALAVLDQFGAASKAPLSTFDFLRAVTAVAMALADAGIQAWLYKYSERHMLWRPALAIHNAVHTAPDKNWYPVGRPHTNGDEVRKTPDFPAYPSGHATFGAAAFQVLRRFLKKHDTSLTFDPLRDDDRISFTFVSDEFNGINEDPKTKAPRARSPRTYPSLWRAIVDNSESRIWLGVHWRMDGISKKDAAGISVTGSPAEPKDLGTLGGVRLGMDIANNISTKLNW